MPISGIVFPNLRALVASGLGSVPVVSLAGSQWPVTASEADRGLLTGQDRTSPRHAAAVEFDPEQTFETRSKTRETTRSERSLGSPLCRWLIPSTPIGRLAWRQCRALIARYEDAPRSRSARGLAGRLTELRSERDAFLPRVRSQPQCQLSPASAWRLFQTADGRPRGYPCGAISGSAPSSIKRRRTASCRRVHLLAPSAARRVAQPGVGRARATHRRDRCTCGSRGSIHIPMRHSPLRPFVAVGRLRSVLTIVNVRAILPWPEPMLLRRERRAYKRSGRHGEGI